MLAALPRSSGDGWWDELLGPFHTWKGAVARLDGVTTRPGLDRRRDRHRVLGCRAGNGSWVYPTFQFLGGTVLAELHRVLAVLVPPTDGWTAGLWLRTPNAALLGLQPAAWLAAGRDARRVVVAAQRQVEE